RCKNFFALGLVYWLYERSLEPTLRWIRDKFAKNPAVLEANTRTLKAGYNYGETTETLPVHYRVAPATIKPGTYRKITGNEALALGLVSASSLANIPLVYATYPITPASDILHNLSEMKRFGVRAVLAPCSPADCFNMVFEAVRIATGYMTPVFLMSDGYLANGAEPWLIPRPEDLPKITIRHPKAAAGANGNGEAHFLPYERDERL